MTLVIKDACSYAEAMSTCDKILRVTHEQLNSAEDCPQAAEEDHQVRMEC